MSYIGSNKLGKMYLGSTAIGKAYLGEDLVFDASGEGGSVTPVIPDLPNGYTLLDYVQNGTNVISTNISPVNSQWEFDLVCDTLTSSNEVIISSGLGYGGQFAAACGNGKWGLGTGAGFYTSVDVTTRSTIYITYTSNGITMTVGNETVSRTATNAHTNKTYLFAAQTNGYFKGKIYSVKCMSGGNFDGIPAQRDSDSKNGIYDLANNIFYPLTYQDYGKYYNISLRTGADNARWLSDSR